TGTADRQLGAVPAQQRSEDLEVHPGAYHQTGPETPFLLLHDLRDPRQRHVEEAPAASDSMPGNGDLHTVTTVAQFGHGQEVEATQSALTIQLRCDSLSQSGPQATAAEDASGHVGVASDDGRGE